MGSVIRCHPFVDGNKRTGTASTSYLLSTFGYGVEAEQRELEDFAVNVAVGASETKDVARWFENHARKSQGR